MGHHVGLLAKAILPGKQNIPIWLTITFGIIGNAVAAWIGVDETKGIDWIRHLLQLAGAVLVVVGGDSLWASIKGKRHA